MKRIRVSVGDGVRAYATVSAAMDLIEALYRTFCVHNPFDEWEDIQASNKLDAIEKWLYKALEQDKPMHRKVADFEIHVN